MQLTSSIVSLGFLASAASAIALEGFEFPDFVPMHKRQTEGPSYECHANCGKFHPADMAILDRRG